MFIDNVKCKSPKSLMEFSKRPTKAFVCSRLVPHSLHEWLLYLVIEALGAVVFSGGTSWPGYHKWRKLDKNDHLLFFILTPSNPSNGDMTHSQMLGKVEYGLPAKI